MADIRKPDFNALRLYTTLRDLGAEPRAILPADNMKIITVPATGDDKRCLVHFEFAVAGELMRTRVEQL